MLVHLEPTTTEPDIIMTAAINTLVDLKEESTGNPMDGPVDQVIFCISMVVLPLCMWTNG